MTLNYENNIDFFTMTINNYQILEKTYECLNNNIKENILQQSTLYLNVDPHPNNINIIKLKEVGEKYFKNVIFNTPDECNCSKAFKWGIKNFTKDYLFIIEANKCIVKNFSINEMIEKFDDNIVEVCLSPTKKEPKILYLTSHPSIWKKEWLKKISNYFSDYVNYEYQLREFALLDNKTGYTLSNPKNIYLSHIGKKYKEEKKFLLANSSTDNEIKNIIKNDGEWHKNIVNKFPSVNKNNLKVFNKKINDKDWIYRWTGVWKYVKNDNFYKRYLKKSNLYKCNK
jgi:hypothetical protein